MKLGTIARLLSQPSPRVLAKFIWNFGWHGMRAVNAFNRRLKKGECFPAFLFLSVTNRCNLKCQGCWVTSDGCPSELSAETIDQLIAECRPMGARFFGILGGEPLLHRGLMEVLGKHRDCYFQVFTNGQLLTRDVAREFRRLGNVTPLVSIEGTEVVSDERRGGQGVYQRSLDALENCRQERLITGVATSLCQTNLDDLLSTRFLQQVANLGAMYMWYYIYRPVGPNPAPELALDPEQVRRVRQFIVDQRPVAPLAIVDAYWDHEGQGLCPAATGISHHINPFGDVEPCPIIQFAKENIADGPLRETVGDSQFLAEFRKLAAETTRGCIVLERPDLLKEFLEKHGAKDCTGRGTGFAELAGMCARNSHATAGPPIPEKDWMYRFAKKHWFFGFGAYG
jgi:MoaA/NifB/PqqE/SkfB family radical SAM enzyme